MSVKDEKITFEDKSEKVIKVNTAKPYPKVIIAPGGNQMTYSENLVRLLGYASDEGLRKAGYIVR